MSFIYSVYFHGKIKIFQEVFRSNKKQAFQRSYHDILWRYLFLNNQYFLANQSLLF